MADTVERDKLLTCATEIISAYLARNAIANSDLPSLIKSVHSVLAGLDGKQEAVPAFRPRISIKRSITPDHLICLEDGKKFKMLKRYLRSRYDMSPEDYRTKWGLPADYPMVAPNYSKVRSAFAKENRLGHTRKTARTKRAKRAA